jgi:hypothetical protein
VPRRDVPGRVHVSVDGQAAGAAPESRLALSRFRVAVPAARASLRRVRGVEFLDPSGCFVLQATDQRGLKKAAIACAKSRSACCCTI